MLLFLTTIHNISLSCGPSPPLAVKPPSSCCLTQPVLFHWLSCISIPWSLSLPLFSTLSYPLFQLLLVPLVHFPSFVYSSCTHTKTYTHLIALELTCLFPVCLYKYCMCVFVCMCVALSPVLGCNGWHGIVSNKCLETHPRRPYLPSSALGIESSIFSLQIHLFSLSPCFALRPSLFQLSVWHSVIPRLSLSVFISLSFSFGPFLLWCGYQLV